MFFRVCEIKINDICVTYMSTDLVKIVDSRFKATNLAMSNLNLAHLKCIDLLCRRNNLCSKVLKVDF
jgi:hypothetical protein